MAKTEVDFIVVGLGIAGIAITTELTKRKISFKVFHQDSIHDASKVSSGLINPVTGRRFVKSWMIEKLRSEAIKFYNDLSHVIEKSIYRPISIIRSLHSVQDENAWLSRSLDPEYSEWIHQHEDQIKVEHLNSGNISYGQLDGGIQIFADVLVEAYRDLLALQNTVINQKFIYNSLKIDQQSFTYNDLTSRYIIFAEGWKAMQNPFFNDLNFQPVKGEVLICHIPGLEETRALKLRKSVVPIGEDKYWIGSTYQWQFQDAKPTLIKKKALIEFIDSTISLPYEIVDHLAGVRPSTFYRRPFVGSHDRIRGMYILNGLGTKGFSLAPYWAKALVENIISQKSLSEEVALYR